MSGFVSLGIIPEISEYLKKRGIINPMPIQKEVIPAIFKGRNIIGRAQTGTGKTLAYLLPLVQRIKKKVQVRKLLLWHRQENCPDKFMMYYQIFQNC